MRYKAIKVDMDYCADPIWVSVDGIRFANVSVSEFEGKLSRGLLHGLEVYRSLWEKSMWTDHLSPTDYSAWPGDDLVDDCLAELQVKLAAQLKEELPDVQVFYSVLDSFGKSVHVEISNKPIGIHPTMVG